MPGIYAIGEKVGTKPTKLLYVGRAKNIKTRLQQHTSGKKQAIDKLVASKFKRNKESELRLKYVFEKRHKENEGPYMECMTENVGYRPKMNKRRGDGSGGKARPSESEVAASCYLALLISVCTAGSQLD